MNKQRKDESRVSGDGHDELELAGITRGGNPIIRLDSDYSYMRLHVEELIYNANESNIL